MVTIYVNLILAKRRTFESVPEKLKEAVKESLLSLGFDKNGNTTTKGA